MSDTPTDTIPTPTATPTATPDAAQATTVESPPISAEAIPKPVDDRLGKRFAALAKQERELRERETRLKTTEDAVKRYEASVSRAKDDPFALLESAGLDRETAVTLISEKLTETPPDPTKTKLEQLESTVTQLLAEREQQTQTAHATHVDTLKMQALTNVITPFIQNNATTYPIVHALGVSGDVLELMEIQYSQGEKPTVEGATKQVEDYLADHIEDLPISLLKKLPDAIKAKFGIAPTMTATDTPEPKKESKTPPKPAKATEKPTRRSTGTIPTVHLGDRDARIKAITSKMKKD